MRVSTLCTDWQQQLREVITDPQQLAERLQLPLSAITTQTQGFALRVPESFVKRMRVGDPHDPLLLQVLPQIAEAAMTPGYQTDPLQEHAYNPVPGLLHKYHGRVLITLTGSCAINCRYCFRRDFPYADQVPGRDGMHTILNYIRSDSSITEVILSGGEPLLVKDDYLANLIGTLAGIPRLQYLRIHTRLPIVIPARITESLMQALQSRLTVVMVLHANHPHELNIEVQQACQLLRDARITLLNQAVLLKNINDNAETLIALSRRLFILGILPYYLHHLGAVQGAAHFAVDPQRGLELIQQIRHQLPGYLLPRYVAEIPGKLSKTPMQEFYCIKEKLNEETVGI